jgi:hypothetical protein
LIDSSVLLEVIRVPGKATRHEEVLASLERKIDAREALLLPMATIIETGNHIGQNGNGAQRRDCARLFVDQVTFALNGESPFQPINFLSQDEMRVLLMKFPDHAMTGSGLGDLSIIQDWEKVCEQNPARRVYIWSFDEHLAAYDRPPLV